MTTSTASGKSANAVGTVLVMGVLVLIAMATAVSIMSIIHMIMADTMNFWWYLLLIVSVAYDVALFSGWQAIAVKLNNFFWNWK